MNSLIFIKRFLSSTVRKYALRQPTGKKEKYYNDQEIWEFSLQRLEDSDLPKFTESLTKST